MATYSVMNVLLSLATFGGGRAERARPKSQSCERTKTMGGSGHAMREGRTRRTLRSQLAFRSRLEGFRSRWRTSAECSALSARRVWGTREKASRPSGGQIG